MSTRIKPVPHHWQPIIEDWLNYLRARGLRPESVATRRRHLAFFLRSNPTLTPEGFTVGHMLTWAGGRDWASETRKSYYASFRSFCSWLQLEGIGDPTRDGRFEIPRVPRPAPSPRPLPIPLARMLLRSTDLRIAMAANLALRAGLRRSEIVLVHDDDFIDDLLGRSLVVHGKGGKSRVIPLADDLLTHLKLYRRQTKAHGWLFPGSKQGHLSSTWLGKLVNRALPSPWTLHCLRHRFATDLYQQTNDILLVSHLLGHENVATTQLYLAIPDTQAREAVNKIAV